MDVVTIMLVTLLLGGVGIAWYLVQRYLRQSGNMDLTRGEAGDGASELAAFVAAYRSGKIDPKQLQQDESAAISAPTSAVPPAAPHAREAAAPIGAKTSVPGALLRPEVKLAYLTLRAGLRDHHVFPNVPVADLGLNDSTDRIDLIVCNPGFAVVAAIDVFAGPGTGNPNKGKFLRASGITYLRFNTKSMPKPGDLRTLIYRA